jgi:preprotein translocase subunit YajC
LFALGIGIVVIGIVAYQLLSHPAATATTATNSDARNQFLAERSGTTTPITGTNGLGAPGGQGAGFPGVVGTVASVASDTLTVQNAANGTATTVHLAANATIRKQVTAQLADIKVGDQLFATGALTGTKLTATVIQLGTTTGGAGFGGGTGRPRGVNGTPGTVFTGTPGTGRQFNGTPGTGRQFNGTPGPQGTPGAGFNGAGFNRVSGTVTAINGSTLTVKTTDGTSATVEVGTSTQIENQQTITLAAVKTGDTVRATGTQNGDIFEATALQVGGFGPGGGVPGGVPPGRAAGTPVAP